MLFSTEKFNELTKIVTTESPCISIFIPTHRAGHVQEDMIRFKNLLSEAEDKLINGRAFSQNKLNKNEATKLLSPAYELLDKEDFWLHLSDGIALFIGEDQFDYFVVPISFNPFVYIGNEFYLRHLLPLLTSKDRFFLLALSQGEVRFFEGHKHHITPVIINDLVPENINEVLINEKEPTLQSHAGGQGNPNFHGQGSGKDQKIDDLKKYFRRIDDGLMTMLHDEQVPMIIAAVDYLVPIYKEVTNYPNVFDFHINGNPENDDPVLLHEKAWALAKGFFEREMLQKKADFTSYINEKKATISLEEIVKSAKDGKVDTLFVDKNTEVVWGFHKQLTDYSVKLYEEQNAFNTCVLNYAAIYTWQNGGTVYNIPRKEFPQTSSEMNAIYRF